jgi:hypothetical protein
MELEELHVFQRDAAAVDDCSPIAGIGIGVGSDLPDAPVSAGGDDDSLGVEGMQFAGSQLDSDNASSLPVYDQQVEHLEFVVELDLVLQALLVQGLQDHVTRAVGGVTGAADGFARFTLLVWPPKGRWEMRPSACGRRAGPCARVHK